jgi:hypothetical protein
VVDEAHAHKLPVSRMLIGRKKSAADLTIGVDDFEHTGLATAPGYPTTS